MAVGEPDYTLPCSTQRGGSIAWSTQRWRRAGGYNVNVNVNVNVNTEEVRRATAGYNVNFSVGHHGHTYRLGSLVNFATSLQRVHKFEANCVKTLIFSG